MLCLKHNIFTIPSEWWYETYIYILMCLWYIGSSTNESEDYIELAPKKAECKCDSNEDKGSIIDSVVFWAHCHFKILSYIHSKKHIVAIVGAGISVDSGIPDFRSKVTLF